MYISESIDPDTLQTAVPHESTHVMKQMEYQPYVEFAEHTAGQVNTMNAAGQKLVEMMAEHIGADVFAMSDEQYAKLCDEVNASLMAWASAGNFRPDPVLLVTVPDLFTFGLLSSLGRGRVRICSQLW